MIINNCQKFRTTVTQTLKYIFFSIYQPLSEIIKLLSQSVMRMMRSCEQSGQNRQTFYQQMFFQQNNTRVLPWVLGIAILNTQYQYQKILSAGYRNTQYPLNTPGIGQCCVSQRKGRYHCVFIHISPTFLFRPFPPRQTGF